MVGLAAAATIVPAFAQPSERLNRQTLEQRAAAAAIWGMPIVSVYAMRQAFFRDAKANYNDIVFWSKPSDWRNQTTTPNASARYVYFNFNTNDGPIVVEIPPAVEAGLFGTLLDAWQVPLADVGPDGEDHGKGGRYLLLPPDFKDDAPAGYIVVRPQTYNGYALFRAISKSSSEADVSNATALVKKLRLYPLVKADSPPEQRFVDMTDKLFDGIVRFDESFYASLAQMIKEEPVLTRDRAMMGLLLPLGIEKGKEFKPDVATQRVLAQSADAAHAWLMNGLLTYSTPHWPDSSWAIPAAPIAVETMFSFEHPDYLDVDARGIGYFSFYAPPKKLGAATFYVGTFKDAKGDLLRGEENYRLHIPPDVPAQQFWALTLYDRETCGFIRDMPRAGLDSYDQKMHKNADGSVDIYIGPRPPAGKEANWIQTASGRGWFPFFRFYGPEKALFEKTWKLPDIERVN
ncbi:DUF1254 domain-containing protein [Bradyrhizobium brasilense]|uniref:DUF1254 domain-containing protein n=1 Tax=Bradyrhizobium brasilense TaxID=1419277 RepID=UPI0028778B55|nr:DUF1254 domain-containing protein [Bradyrhizobium brasilense]MCP3413936.1 DUF1254 domain-containing protein [Bradyrhizobium brasilense]